jgi:glycosyltransferase involved in cell wall biosynthesis
MSEKTLNVCLYTPTPDGGHALYAQELLTAIADVGARRGVAPELVTCEDIAPPHWTSAYPIHPILPRLAPRSSFGSTLAWAASRVTYYARREHVFLDWVARRDDLDVVHFQEYTPWLAPRHWDRLRRRGLGIVFTVHNVFLHFYRNRLHKLVRDSCLRRAWRSCDALFVHSDGLKAALADFLGPGHPLIAVTPHGVWNGHEGDVPSPAARGDERPRLLFFGVLRPNKGLHVLLRALERLPGCDLTVAGEPDEPSYHKQVRELAGRFAPGRVELIDRYVDEREVPELFRRSRLVVLPYTFFASQSGVLHMALAHRRPVVASDLGAMGECVRAWGIGRVVPASDERALAEAIEGALEPDEYRRAAEATDRVRDDLTWTRTAEATIDVYRAIVA